ncbi:MAG: hypothetical protein ACKO8Q_05185 [Bacteroidota bacterium]
MKHLLTVICFLFAIIVVNGQQREKIIPPSLECIVLDSLIVKPSSIQVFVFGTDEKVEFRFYSQSNSIYRLGSFSDSLRVIYEPLNFPYGPVIQDYNWNTNKPDKFKFSKIENKPKEYYTDQIQKFGSISRSVNVGNQQNLGAQSALNLQLKGKIANRFQLVASISDNQLPIQASGTTQQIQELDQVFIQLSDANNKWIAGDFALAAPSQYFMKYTKRGLGLYLASNLKWKGSELKTESSISISKGRFQRQSIQGIEGVQGPYRLQGANGERFVTVLAGTETVYIDGKKLIRGLDQDYAIDYNTAEIIFTSKQRITKDKRIVVEFQYADRQYFRPLITTQTESSFGQNGKMYSQFFLEADVKNQPVSQQLSEIEREVLSEAGNSMFSTYISSIDSVGYDVNQIRYALVDSMGVDSILVYSTNASAALYTAVFTYVGVGNGNYIEKSISPFGKVYSWVAPLAGIPQGSYEPVRKLSAPTSQLMWVFGVTDERKKKNVIFKYRNETALSKFDANTFSNSGNQINMGAAALTEGSVSKQAAYTSHEFNWKFEYLSVHFKRIERFREVEFERNWNLLPLQSITSSQQQGVIGYKWNLREKGFIQTQAGLLNLGKDYFGKKLIFKQNVTLHKRYVIIIDAWALNSEGVLNSTFLRQKINIFRNGKKLVFGFKDEQELNKVNTGITSYGFFDGEFYLQTQDSTKQFVKLFARNRTDQSLINNQFTPFATAWNGGIEGRKLTKGGTQLGLILNQRNLQILDPSSSLVPVRSTLGRVECRTSAQKLIQFNVFYESGSGLSPIQAYVYAEVPIGQGNYVWNDYNENGVKEIEEFEIAAFAYEANYIRLPVQTTEYQNVFNANLTSSLNIQFSNKRIWENDGLKKVLSPFSISIQHRSDTRSKEFGNRLIPLAVGADSLWLGYSNSQRGGLYFKRGNPVFSSDLVVSQIENKNQLLSGYELKRERNGQAVVRMLISNFWNTLIQIEAGRKLSASDFLSIKNYEYTYMSCKPAVYFQPTTKRQLGISADYSNKSGTGGDSNFITKSISCSTLLQWELKENQLFKAEAKWTKIDVSGNLSGSALYDVLNGLQAGNNFLLSVDWRKFINENLQLSLQYNGRKSENRNLVHAGSMSVRLLFN